MAVGGLLSEGFHKKKNKKSPLGRHGTDHKHAVWLLSEQEVAQFRQGLARLAWQRVEFGIS